MPTNYEGGITSERSWLAGPLTIVFGVFVVLTLGGMIALGAKFWGPEARARADVERIQAAEQTRQDQQHWDDVREDVAAATRQGLQIGVVFIAVAAVIGTCWLSAKAWQGWQMARRAVQPLPDRSVIVKCGKDGQWIVDPRVGEQYRLGEPRDGELEKLQALAEFRASQKTAAELLVAAIARRGVQSDEDRKALQWASQVIEARLLTSGEEQDDGR